MSREHGFAFVHVIKTGGTSIARSIEDQLGLDSARVPIARIERLRRSFRYRVLRTPVLGKHAYAIDIRNQLGDDYERLLTFAFVRNPWDWLVSLYTFISTQTISPDTSRPWKHPLSPMVSKMDFGEFVLWVVQENGLAAMESRMKSSFAGHSPVLQRDWISDIDGRIIVDFVGRFENLDNDFGTLAGRLGLPNPHLPHVNASSRQSTATYYTPDLVDAVGEYFRGDIETFGYSQRPASLR